MKLSAVWCAAAGVVALLACGSNNGTGSGSFPFSGPSCTSIPTGCWDCVEQNCNGGCITTACADYFSCYCACAMGDPNCYAGCEPKRMNQACEQCYAGVSTPSCQQSCSSQCSVSGGSSSGVGGSSGFGSSSGSGSSSSGSGGGAACLSSDGSLCYTYSVSGYTCPAMTTTVGSCSTSNDLGSCAISATGSNGATVTATEYYYCAGAFANTGSASTFQSACTSANGMWTAGSVAQCGTGSSSGSGSSGGSSSGSGSSGGSGSSSGGPTDGGVPSCHSVPCGTMGQMETFCESLIGTTCTAAWYTVGSQTFDCNSCTDCTTAAQEASKACP
jgi:hypothetical protein